MKFSISYPTNGTTKSFNVDDDNRCRAFFEKRMGQEVEADTLGEQFKGYVFRINGGFDKDGFVMKQGVFSNNRVRLLLSPGTKGYRCKRNGQRKRRSIRGCIVGPDISMLSLTMVKKGDKEIPGLTDETANRRLGPKRATGIRKLYGIEKVEGQKTLTGSVALIKKHCVKRTFKSKKSPNAPDRKKAPKIQRLVTDVRLRRKRICKQTKIRRWKKSLASAEQYKKLYDKWSSQKRAALHVLKQERKESAVRKDSVKDTKPVEKKPETKKTKPAVATKPVDVKAKKTVVKK